MQSNPKKSKEGQGSSGREASRAKTRQARAQGSDSSAGSEAAWFSALWRSPAWLVRSGSSWRTSQASLFGDEGSELYSESWPAAGMAWHGGAWTVNSTDWPNDGSASLSSLASVLEPECDVPPKCYLSPKACAGILRRAERRGRELPAALRRALEAVAQRGLETR